MREVLENLDEHTELLKKMLTEELFIPDYHKPSIINESSSKKTRRILKPHYKYEQVIHHCAIGQFKPIVMNGLYEFSCGSIPDRGVHYGKKYMRKWLDSYDGKKFFVLKMDVHHFFESINRRILKRKLKEVIRDKRFYRLLCILIEHDKIERRMNMTDWKKVTGTQPDKPEEVDRTSSPSTVYLRKNIEQVTREVEGSDGKMQTVTEWQYDEKEMTVKEYENMALMKSVVEENTSGIVESVTQFQKDAVIDEYTQQLIEEGLI